MNAMFAPAVTTTRLDGRTAMPFSAASLASMARDQRRQPLNRSVVVILGRLAERGGGLHRFGRGAVRHHSLAERNRPGRLGDQAADNGNDRRLHRLHAP